LLFSKSFDYLILHVGDPRNHNAKQSRQFPTAPKTWAFAW
jgi:hypothetical protein